MGRLGFSVWRASMPVLALILLVAGGGAASSAATGARIANATTARAQLAISVLPKDGLGADARALEVDIGSGFTDNAAAIEGTLDPNDTGRQLARAGRIVGYDLSYSDLSLMPLVRGSGLLSMGSSFDLFKTSHAADAFMTKQLRDARRFRGKFVEYGRLVASSTFPTGRIGDRSIGLRTTGMIGDKRFHETLVGFRIGALVAAVTVDRADAKPVEMLAGRLARSLDARARLAAGGKLKAQPVPVPEIGRKGHRPSGGLDLAAMALSLRDLPKGTKLARQGYVDDRSTIGSYEREFDSSAAQLRANMVESDVSLFRHTKEATGFLRGVRVIYTAKRVELWLGTATGDRSLKVEQHPAVSAGDESVSLVFRGRSSGTDIRVALIHLRVGRTLGTLIAGGPASSFRLAEVRPLATMLASHIRNAG